jgi:peptidylprolyl isomerase domain and WD repeat-containing protein 1
MKRKEAPQDDVDDDDDYGPKIVPTSARVQQLQLAAEAPQDDIDDDDDYGPRPSIPSDQNNVPHEKQRKTLNFGELFLEHLPNAAMYEWSYMHRDQVTHVLSTPHTNFLITASRDGVIKFWKKSLNNIEFVKTFIAHANKSPITSLCVSQDGLLLCSSSRQDRSIKIFDVVNFDMINMITFDESFTPSLIEFALQAQGSAKRNLLVVCNDSDNTTTTKVEFRVYDVRDTDLDASHCLFKYSSLHTAPNARVILMKYNQDTMVTCDHKGMIEYWDPLTGKFPTSNNLKFKFKTETDLYEFCKQKTYPLSIEFSHDGNLFVCMGRDYMIRLFDFHSGKLRCTIDETLERAAQLQRSQVPEYMLENIDFGRRMAIEKDIEHTSMNDPYNELMPHANAVFDQSGYFIIYPTMLGIKVVNVHTNRVERLLGKVENTERFMSLCVSQQPVKASKSQILRKQSGDAKLALQAMDPTIYCTGYKKNRFYCFSRREPSDDDSSSNPNTISGLVGAFGRDVFNEKPSKEDVEISSLQVRGQQQQQQQQPQHQQHQQQQQERAKRAIIHTTCGDIQVKLFGNETPRAVYNFTQLGRDGYYNGVTFHRVIKGFMVQTGDPQGDGTGGNSIWGHEFEDEFTNKLRHDKPGKLSMANAGPNTNSSQFFITTVPTPWLDDKHTLFGEVVRGMDVIYTIENIKVDKRDKPEEPVDIISIDYEF